jgi:hypothetical protein
MINSWQDDEAGMKGAGDAAEAQSSEMIVRDLRGALAPAQEPPPEAQWLRLIDSWFIIIVQNVDDASPMKVRLRMLS